MQLQVAGGFLSRLRGLMFAAALPADHGLLITHCTSVHTCFMRQTIDVLYLDADGRILHCVRSLKPWRTSWAPRTARRDARARHVLELAVGSIARLRLRPGDRVFHPELNCVPPPAPTTLPGDAVSTTPQARAPLRQKGAAIVEFVVVGPVLILLGSAILQYCLLFFAKNQFNHAAFMAARAGAMHNADLGAIRTAYARNLIPLFGGGRNTAELTSALQRAQDAVEGTNGSGRNDKLAFAAITLLNPTRESFDDWNDARLQRTVGGGRQVIRNANLTFADPAKIGASSGQNLFDANLLKLRILQGYEPKVPLMGLIYTKYLKWLDTKTDVDRTALIERGLIPVETVATVQMQSDAIEPGNPVSSPGPGNGGHPTDPGNPSVVSTDPLDCLTIGCTTGNDPGAGGGDPPCY